MVVWSEQIMSFNKDNSQVNNISTVSSNGLENFLNNRDKSPMKWNKITMYKLFSMKVPRALAGMHVKENPSEHSPWQVTQLTINKHRTKVQ